MISEDIIAMKTEHFLVVVLLALLTFQVIGGMQDKSITFDERTHITAGYSYWKTFDFRMNPEHPPFSKLLAGIPLLFLNPSLPLDDPNWDEIPENVRYQWPFANRFLFEGDYDVNKLVFYARLPMVLLALLLAWYIYRWSRELFGKRAGLLALFLAVLSPNIIAHAKIVHTDLGIATFFFIATYYLWHYLNTASKKNLLLCGLFFGLAVGTKFTGLYLAPLFIILTFVFFYFKDSSLLHFHKKHPGLLLGLLKIVGIGALVVLCLYGVKEIAYFAKGLGYVISHSSTGHPSFLLGEYSADGRWHYFIVAMLLKVPIPMIILFVLSLVTLGLSKQKIRWLPLLFLLIPVALYLTAFSINNINIGLRHILPVFPFLFVFVSRLAKLRFKRGRKLFQPLIILLLIFYAWEAAAIFPHHLAYFNQFAGGPDNGWHYLIDSNIDWGQDLLLLQKYVVENQIPELHLSYFGRDLDFVSDIPANITHVGCYPVNGVLAVSVNHLQGISPDQHRCMAWLREHYTPIDKAGYSIFIYNVSDISKQEEGEGICLHKCKQYCRKTNKYFFNSSYSLEEDECSCGCAG